MARKTRKQRGGGGAGGENGSRRQRARSTSPVTGIPEAESSSSSLYNYPGSLIKGIRSGIGSLFKTKQAEGNQGSPTVYEEIQRLHGILESQGSTDSILRVNKEELDAIRSARQNQLTLIGVTDYERGAIDISRAKRRALIDVTPAEIAIIEFVRKHEVRLEYMQHLKKPAY